MDRRSPPWLQHPHPPPSPWLIQSWRSLLTYSNYSLIKSKLLLFSRTCTVPTRTQTGLGISIPQSPRSSGKFLSGEIFVSKMFVLKICHTVRSLCNSFRQTVSKTVLKTVLRMVLGCVHTANPVNEIEQLKEACRTFGRVLRLSKNGVPGNGSIACICNSGTRCCSG